MKNPSTLTNRTLRLTRAEFSPIGGLSQSRTHFHPTTLIAPARAVEAVPARPERPAWHRGPLDRLQVPLTRYRD